MHILLAPFKKCVCLNNNMQKINPPRIMLDKQYSAGLFYILAYAIFFWAVGGVFGGIMFLKYWI